MILASAGILYRTLAAPVPLGRTRDAPRIRIPELPIVTGNSPTIGAKSARVGLVIYSDFFCPFCAKFGQDTWPRLRETFVDGGRLFVIFRHLPLEQIHPEAGELAALGHCASAQDRFWSWHDIVLRAPANRRLETGRSPGQAGLARRALDECVAEGKGQAQVQSDLREAATLGISSTPSFLFGENLHDGSVQIKKVLVGAKAFEDFLDVIESIEREK